MGKAVHLSSTAPSKLDTAKKAARVIELRKQGYSMAAIAAELDCSETYATKIFKKAINQVTKEPAEEYVKLELERLDDLFIKAYVKATKEGTAMSAAAIEACLRIIDRRIALMGVTKVKPEAPTLNMDEARARLAARMQAILDEEEASANG